MNQNIELELPVPPDFIVRLPEEGNETVNYTIFDNSGTLRQNIGKGALSTILGGEQPWADFAVLDTLAKPTFVHGDAIMPIVLNRAGLAMEVSNFSIMHSCYPEETIDAFTLLHPDVRFHQRDVAFQHELVFDETGIPRLLSTRQHELIGELQDDGTFVPFVTHLSWLHPVRVLQD